MSPTAALLLGWLAGFSTGMSLAVILFNRRRRA